MRQPPQRRMHFVDRGHAMTDHRQIVPGRERQLNRFVEIVFIQDRAHIEIVGHDQTVEPEFFAQ